MRAEDLRGLNIEGLTDSAIEQITKYSEEELKNFVSKVDYDKVNNELTNTKSQFENTNKTLEKLQKENKDNESLTTQIQELTNQNENIKKEYEEKIKEMVLNNNIKASITDAYDSELVANLIDKSKLVIDKDKVIGLEEQIKNLKETKPFLFKPSQTIINGPKEPTPQDKSKKITLSLNDVVKQRLQQNGYK